MQFDKKDTLDHLKQVGRVLEYWKEKAVGENHKRKVLLEIDGKVQKCVATKGANQFQYKARIEGTERELIICVNSNYVFELQTNVVPKTIRRKMA